MEGIVFLRYSRTFHTILLFMPCCLFGQSPEFARQFQQILPRGAISAIVAPHYVPAQKALIGKNTWVLGITVNGQARAYSLNLLNFHEVVNDQNDSVAFAAVW